MLFRGNGQFAVTDVTAAAGLSGLSPTYQAAWADFDNDGDLDLVSAGKLFENQGTTNSWLRIALRGDGAKVSTSAIGAQVRVHVNDKVLTRQVEAGTGEGNQNELTLHFGLGTHKGPVEVEVFWPNKVRQQLKDVQLKRLVTIPFP